MPTPQEEKLDAMLDTYRAAHKTDTTDPGKELRSLIETTPGLKATFLDQVDKELLVGFAPLTRTDALGSYSAEKKTMAVSIDQLNMAADGNVQVANSLRFTLGHEIDHAVTRDAKITEDATLKDSVDRIAKGPSPHDYTATLKAYNESVCSREVAAEIAGFNTLAGYVTSKNPNATLKDMYAASPNDLEGYVDIDLSKTPATYTPKQGLTLGSDLTMAPSQANIDAMKEYFYKAQDYPVIKLTRAIEFIEATEQREMAAARASNPDHPAPDVEVDFKELGVDDESSRRRATATQTSVAASQSKEQAPPQAAGKPPSEGSSQQGNPQNLPQRLDHMLNAAHANDWASFRQGTQDFANMPAGQQLRQDAAQAVNKQEQAVATIKHPEQAAIQQVQQPAQAQQGFSR